MLRLSYLIFILISVFSIAYSLGYSDNHNAGFVCILPFAFLVYLIIFSTTYFKLKKSFIFKVFLLQSSLRYLLLPVLYSSGQVLAVGNNSTYIEFSIIVMVIELFLVFLVFTIYAKKNNLDLNESKAQMSYMKGYILIPIILFLMFFYIYSSGALSKVSLIWNLDDYVEQYVTQGENLEVDTLGVLMFNSFKVILIVFLISYISQTRIFLDKQKKWLLMLIVIGSGLFIVGTSRFSIILNMAVLFSFLPFFMNEKDTRKVLYISFPIVFLILLTVTVAKFSRYGSELSSNSIFTASEINAYFSGFGNIAVGFEAYDKIPWKESFLFFFNDTFQNIPILSKLTVQNYKTTVVFNDMVYGHRAWADQIVPLSISGLFHFGYIGLFIYSPLFVAIAMYMERLAYKVNFIGYKYILLYLSVSLSLIFMLNIGSFYSILTGTFLFIFIPFFVIKLFNSLSFKVR